MAFTTSNVTFANARAYQSELGLSDEVMPYDYEYGINPFSKRILANKYGEMLLRQGDIDGEYTYYVVTFNNHICEDCNCAFKLYDMSYFTTCLERALDEYFNDAPENDGFVGVFEEDDCYAQIHPELSTEEEFDGIEYDRICGEQYQCQPPMCPYEEEILYNEEYGCQIFHFTDDYTIIPSLDSINCNYSKKYQLVLDLYGTPYQTYKGEYISRIKKANGKHRYYLTQIDSEWQSDDLCYKPDTLFHAFKSTYVGRDLFDVLQQFVYAPLKWV
jgi:hypothetical protein